MRTDCDWIVRNDWGGEKTLQNCRGWDPSQFELACPARPDRDLPGHVTMVSRVSPVEDRHSMQRDRTDKSISGELDAR